MTNLWQSATWEQFQHRLGRQTFRLSDSTLVVQIPIQLGQTRYDVLRASTTPENWQTLIARAQEQNILSIRYAPSSETEREMLINTVDSAWIEHQQQQFPAATRIIHLDGLSDDQAVLTSFESQGRRHTRQALKQPLECMESVNLKRFAEFQHQTGARQGFSGHPLEYYERLFDVFQEAARLYVVKHSQTGVWHAAGIFVTSGDTFYYYYGASSGPVAAQLQAPTLLQYRAMCIARSEGFKQYDLLGVSHPDADETDRLAGVTRFKRKFGGEVITYGDEIILPLRPLAHSGLEFLKSVRKRLPL